MDMLVVPFNKTVSSSDCTVLKERLQSAMATIWKEAVVSKCKVLSQL
jgi:hypothetical protein